MEYTTWHMQWAGCLIFGEKMQMSSDSKDRSKMGYFNRIALQIHSISCRSSNVSREGLCLQADENSFYCSSPLLPIQTS
ncbi:hypothetical protein I3843_02G143200 [Carya illinoinensis]|nr:hypothetical protein I3760_02G165200 [Carya illinoinensis]KAG7992757.1 hypothetical protein I3843_02G143200 [Carya illinoinensis]